MALCLNQLLSNKRSSPFVLINDSIQFSGLPLLAEFAASTLRENHTLIVVLTETSPEAWTTRLQQQQQQSRVSDTTTPLSNNSKTYIIDAYTDPLGWDDIDQDPTATAQKGRDCNAPFVLERVHDIRDMERSILKPIIEKMPVATSSGGNDTVNECTILIDSIHPLLMVSQQRTYQLVKALESLTTDAIRLVVGHHADTELPRNKNTMMVPTVDALNRLASVILSLEPLPQRTMYDAAQEALTGFTAQESFTYMRTTSNLVEKGGLARIEWRKKSGKVQYETNGFYLGSKNNLIVVEASQLLGDETAEVSMDVEDLKPQQQQQVDPMANLPFNLSLTDNQRRAKDNVELPFMKVQEQQQPSGHIYYEPDAGDDFDDEDPDDDLDI
ncbi:Elongator complex protein 5 [Zychaea mexicana]|uniref:Elongator complex protein 5 n=1 Tax=Zychaea mexicana TaxID=64656 RepID=UPI0022FDEAD1|nr:Elongator complex protein 5 [Zychaea mexicana]KAI9491362.1 Elongator complex protein 5 [Zychaea mexicana]